MIYTVQISSRAETDLREIYGYIAYELLSPPTATRQLQRLEEEILSLDQMPNRYPAYLEEPWHSRGLRVMSVDNYLVFYIPDAATQTVSVTVSCTADGILAPNWIRWNSHSLP